MSDLISRSELIKLINTKYIGLNDAVDLYHGGKFDCFEEIKLMIKKQPTAYDIDRVVKELEKEAERWEDSGKEYKDKCEIAVGRGLRNSIEIVKRGGVSDDVCEWKLEDGEANLYLTKCQQRQLIFEGTPKENEYRYCPYCGKKIKVVE